MKAIMTKVMPATNTKGTRIKAYDSDNNSVTVSWEHELNEEENAIHAAYKLKEKMNWKGDMAWGWVKEGYIFVFINNNEYEYRKDNPIECNKSMYSRLDKILYRTR